MANNRSSVTKRLKETISNHPLGAIVGIVIASISTSASIHEYFTRQHVASIEDKTNQQIAFVEDATKRRVEKLEADHARELYAANVRMSSIERRIAISGDEKFIDVAAIPIAARFVPSLDSSYRAVARNDVYVNVVEDSTWKYRQGDELQLLAL